MSQIKEMPLSLKSDTFSALSSDFDGMLRQLLQGMVDTGENSGTINIKVKVSLTEDSAPVFTVAGGQQTRSITKPKFDHEVSAVIQRKDKRTGSLSGDFELVRDGNGGYVMRHIDDGQYDLFNQEGGEVIEAEYMALPGHVEGEEGNDTQDGGDGAQGAFTRFEDTPFGWLSQFVDEPLRVTEAMGNFTVRSERNQVILSSAASETDVFYCPAEKLEPHVGHNVKCVSYGGDEIVTIAIECEDCADVIFEIDRPDLDGDAEEGRNGVDGSDDDEAYADGYEYDPPAEEDGEKREEQQE